MNYSYNFDINVYNSFIYYSGGYPPTYHQYQAFANNLYQGQMQNYLANQTHMPPQHIQMLPVQIQAHSTPSEQIQISPERKLSFCIKGMECKDIKCNDYHHPSKDLDILNASKK
jgi:hypothetical protein